MKAGRLSQQAQNYQPLCSFSLSVDKPTSVQNPLSLNLKFNTHTVLR